MHITTAILVLQCTFTLTIKVPVAWSDSSDVNPITLDRQNEYFHYPAKKPQFAIDVAMFHDVKNPEQHYKSYPINPHTGVNKLKFGTHQLLDKSRTKYKPYQEFIRQENRGIVRPVSNYYEIYHPYKTEISDLQNIYKDPVLNKIRDDVRDSKNRLKKYEIDAGESDIQAEEHLESPEDIDKKTNHHKNEPVQFEVHSPLRRPAYYQRAHLNNDREKQLNKKLVHPWKQNYIKIAPIHYHPLKHHLHNLRQQHALTYDDERNEYPQVLPPEKDDEKPEGYDIYEKGKKKYEEIRDVFDESLKKAMINHGPVENENLEFRKEHYVPDHHENDEVLFVPIKNYAQVRKTETYKHLPRSAAYEDAQDLEEIQNAPRLREAIKSSKNQIVYSEEGYEDTAYDHAGEQKHASDHERHGGYLKEDEISKGRYKIPTEDTNYENKGKSSSRNQVLHGEKWNDELKKHQRENESEDYSDNENDYSEIGDTEESESKEIDERSKRENKLTEHDLAKREIELTTSLEKNLQKVHKAQKEENSEQLNIKYPYYNKKFKLLNENSPLRYSENLKLIPKKEIDSTAFYNSRKTFECPEVETEINPVPDKFHNGKVTDESDDDDDENGSEKGEEEFKKFKNKQRLKGLGDKIDCLKAKYFGEDPLDSPFFKEEIVKSPVPVLKPNSKIFTLNKFIDKSLLKDSKIKPNMTRNVSISPKQSNSEDIIQFNDTLYNNDSFSSTNSRNLFKKSLDEISRKLKNKSVEIKQTPPNNDDSSRKLAGFPNMKRIKRATFNYEPYKVIKENQSSDSKRLATSSNISPLIKKLQTRQVIEKTSNNNDKVYKNIGKNDRPFSLRETDFIDVSSDQRRGEPRYELEVKNHRSDYKPSENKTSISLDDYKARTAIVNEDDSNKRQNEKFKKQDKNFLHVRSPSSNRPNFDISKFLPQTLPTQSIEASNTVIKSVYSTTAKYDVGTEEYVDEDEYEDYDEDEKPNEKKIEPHSTSTTSKPTSKKRLAPIAKLTQNNNLNSMKLNLVTQFHTSTTEATITERDIPSRFREKKKKSSKSTLVTDVKNYGEDTDDMKKEEIDAMIGVKQDMDEYSPTYEREEKRSNRNNKDSREVNIRDVKLDEDEEEDGEEEDDDDDEENDYNDDEDEDVDEEDEEDDDEDSRVKPTKDKKLNDSGHRRGTTKHEMNHSESLDLQITTSEPTKRTLIKMTEPPPTTEILHTELKPTVLRKKVEIHKELPSNKNSPHLSQFKQDIKEIEIIKQSQAPKSTSRINTESLDLYKDENLAKEINNLGDIEIFKEDLDFESGPRHGGNYRKAEPEESDKSNSNSTTDVETSETETKKVFELETTTKTARSRSDVIRSRNHGNRNNLRLRKKPKRTESDDSIREKSKSVTKERHSKTRVRNRPNDTRSAKLIELQEDENMDSSRMHGGNFKAETTRNGNRPMHGGNYRSAELTLNDEATADMSTTKRNIVQRRNRKSEAQLLNAYANAISVITTTPAYILDPSKRMYYYVEK